MSFNCFDLILEGVWGCAQFTPWSLDQYRLNLISSSQIIYSYEYNNPFYLYVFRWIAESVIFSAFEKSYLFWGFANALISSLGISIFYCALRLCFPKRSFSGALCLALLPIYPFHVDVSSESMRFLGCSAVLFCSLAFVRRPTTLLAAGIMVSLTFTGLVSITYAATCVALIVLVFYFLGQAERLKFKSPPLVLLILILGLGLVLVSLMRMHYFKESFVTGKAQEYYDTSSLRAEQDRNALAKRVDDVVSQLVYSTESQSSNTGKFVAKAIWTLYGLVYPHFGQAIFFDKVHWIFFFGALAIFSFFKCSVLLGEIFTGVRHRRWSNFVAATVILLIMIIPAYFWGPNYDSVRIVASFAPIFMLLAVSNKACLRLDANLSLIIVAIFFKVLAFMSFFAIGNRFEPMFERYIAIGMIFLWFAVFLYSFCEWYSRGHRNNEIVN